MILTRKKQLQGSKLLRKANSFSLPANCWKRSNGLPRSYGVHSAASLKKSSVTSLAMPKQIEYPEKQSRLYSFQKTFSPSTQTSWKTREFSCFRSSETGRTKQILTPFSQSGSGHKGFGATLKGAPYFQQRGFSILHACLNRGSLKESQGRFSSGHPFSTSKDDKEKRRPPIFGEKKKIPPHILKQLRQTPTSELRQQERLEKENADDPPPTPEETEKQRKIAIVTMGFNTLLLIAAGLMFLYFWKDQNTKLGYTEKKLNFMTEEYQKIYLKNFRLRDRILSAEDQTVNDLRQSLAEQVPTIAKKLRVSETTLLAEVSALVDTVAEKRHRERTAKLEEESLLKERREKLRKENFMFDEL